MSLLSDTTHTPQRVHALLRLVEAQGETLDFETIKAWFKPDLRGADGKATEGGDNNIRQMIGAATSMGYLESTGQNRYKLAKPVPPTLGAFADDVHAHLVLVDWDDADSIMLEAYAAMLVQIEAHDGTAWLELAAKDKAARINAGVRHDEAEDEDDNAKRFNSTKASPWRRWMIFLGLGVQLKGEVYPYPAERMLREIAAARTEDAMVEELPLEDFLAQMAKRMPYLDGGRLFEASAAALKLPRPDATVSRVTSGTLRDLHDDQRITLLTIGDTRRTVKLASEPHPVRSATAIRLTTEALGG